MRVIHQPRVRVEVGFRRSEVPQPEGAVHAMLGVASRDGSWLGTRYPTAVVTPAARSTRGAVLEHLRFNSRHKLDGLPGLDAPAPSLLRDSAALALHLGAQSVDLLLLRVPGATPEQVHFPEHLEPFAAVLAQMPGVVVTAPDLLGPHSLLDGARKPAPDHWSRIREICRVLGPVWRESWQLAMLDAPKTPTGEALGAGGADAALWGWAGNAGALARHGWRSAAVAAAARRSRTDDPVYLSHVGVPMQLDAGRRIRRRQRPTDSGAQRSPVLVNEVLLDAEGETALVQSEHTLRAPVGSWPIPVVRTVQGIHRLIRRAADEFVFRPVTELNSVGLSIALNLALQPFVQAGVLRGLAGSPTPTVTTEAERDPLAPGLAAEISASVRPWARRVKLRVAVEPGEMARVEMV
jgi:hypothetical protein